MSDFDIKMDTGRNLSIWNQVQLGLTDAVRDTLNEIAMMAGDGQRTHLRRVFTIRSRWVLGSIWPKLGKKRGLVPDWAKDVNRMYSRAGTISPLLAKQEEGWSKKDPSVPSKFARTTDSHKRAVRKKHRLKSIRPNSAITPAKTMSQIPDHRDRVSALLAFANKVNWKGLILIEDDSVMPAGYYKFKGRSLKMLRVNEKGRKPRRAIRWHEDAIRGSQLNRYAQPAYNTTARRRLSRLSG